MEEWSVRDDRPPYLRPDESSYTWLIPAFVVVLVVGLAAGAYWWQTRGFQGWSLPDEAPAAIIAARGASSERTTICISSQAGCAVACPFCATGQAGFGRQLTPGEIVDQVLHWHRPPWTALGEGGLGHYNIVFMGMGEPLNNADRVFEAVRLLNDPQRLGIGARHITVSTSGVVPGMDRMVDELPQVNLAISLHAATDPLRDELVPINRKWPVAEVIAAGRRFAARTGRRVSLEYVMIDGVNDTDEQAHGLVEHARGWRTHVNLIPLNPTPGSKWTASDPQVERTFVERLRAHGIPTTVRDTRGREIDGACGQLATVTA